MELKIIMFEKGCSKAMYLFILEKFASLMCYFLNMEYDELINIYV